MTATVSHLPVPVQVLVERQLKARLTSMAGVEVHESLGGALVECPAKHVAWNVRRILLDEGHERVLVSERLVMVLVDTPFTSLAWHVCGGEL